MNLPDVVVLFGASGFIGRNIVNALCDRVELIGVTASGRPVPGCARMFASPGASTGASSGEVLGLSELGALPARTAIVHEAAFRYFASRFGRQQADILAVNTGLTERVYRFALDRGITEIRVASSAAVYPAAWAVHDDATPLDPNAWPHDGEAAYAWSKQWGEITADLWQRRAGINTISMRLTNPYGPHDTLDEAEAHVATAFIIRALGAGDDFEIRGDPDAERDFVYAGDVAATFVASLGLRGVHAAVNCASGQRTRIADLATLAMRAAGRERPLRTNPPPPNANAGIKVRRATASRLRQVLPDLPPFRSVADGMQASIDWYRDALR